MIEPEFKDLSLKRQCELLHLSRSSFYYEGKGSESPLNLELLRLIDEIYTAYPFFGSRSIRAFLRVWYGLHVSRDRVRRLMRLMGIEGKAPGRKTTVRHPGHKVYPNVLRNMRVTRPNQVWCTDITYLPMPQGSMYLVCILDWYSRKVISWELSNSLDSNFCIRALEKTLETAQPEVFHSDQGCQFTSNAFTKILKDKNITISMAGRGRCYDNIFIERFWRSLKTEEIYKNDYRSVKELRDGVQDYICFYNTHRPHASLEYLTPFEVHHAA